MARPSSQRLAYAELLEKYGRQVAEAFFKALDDLKKGVRLQQVVAAIENGDLEGALAALNIEPAAYNAMLDRIRDAHTAGGELTASAIKVRFDGRNPRAEAWLKEHSSALVSRIVQDQRAAVRELLRAGLADGRNPRSTALDIVGRINRVTGRRTGGILGLSGPQASYLSSARNELASSDPALLRNYLERKRRDRRFDRSVTKAIRESKAVPKGVAANAATAYGRRLEQLRGETIARVETMTALQESKHEAYRQAIEAGRVDEAAVTKVWRSAGDPRVRDSHAALNGESVRFDQSFVSPTGAVLRFPMDTRMGAGLAEIANCRCDCEYRIDFLRNVR